MTDTELKPCPFCGSKARYRNFQTAEDEVTAFVECTGCEAHTMAVSDAYADKRAAIHYWNTRQPDKEAEGLAEALEELSDEVCGDLQFFGASPTKAYDKARAKLKAYHAAKRKQSNERP